MSEDEIRSLVSQLDGSGSAEEWAIVRRLREFGPSLPSYLLERYREAISFKVRSACVYHSVRFAREAEDAVRLGVEALNDRSKVVRYRAAMLLAYSQRQDVVGQLKRRAAELNGLDAADLLAAADAIENQNPNFFVDRDHSGLVTLQVH